jgi:hypothetical protein
MTHPEWRPDRPRLKSLACPTRLLCPRARSPQQPTSFYKNLSHLWDQSGRFWMIYFVVNVRHLPEHSETV